MTFRHASNVISVIGAASEMPAQITPCLRLGISASSAVQASASATFMAWVVTFALPQSATVSFRPSLFRSTNMSLLAPASHADTAQARPMPDAAPVMRIAPSSAFTPPRPKAQAGSRPARTHQTQSGRIGSGATSHMRRFQYRYPSPSPHVFCDETPMPFASNMTLE